MSSTEFQLIHLQDFLHLIGRSVRQISLAARSKNRRGADDVRSEEFPERTNGCLFEPG